MSSGLISINIIRRYLLVVLCFYGINLFSQNEARIWYFGGQAGLDFNTSPPTILTNGQINTANGCASIADATGSLLFYTDGVTVWNKQHLIMANGTGLSGGVNGSAQGALIVPQPSNPGIYYVFHLGNSNPFTLSNGIYYSIVDMNLASGNGSVTAKNFTLYQGNNGWKLTATRHCNGTDIWVVASTWNTIYNNGISNGAYDCSFISYLLTPGGLTIPGSATAVITTYSSLPGGSSGGPAYSYDGGCMKISPNGKKLAIAHGYPSTLFDKFMLYDFDNSTGTVSNPFSLWPWISNPSAWGIEFSPDGSKLYGSSANTPGATGIYQWDLCGGSNVAVLTSSYYISTNSVTKGSLQLAPDGKIYVANQGLSSLSVINNPNLPGAACNFSLSAQSVGTTTCYLGLPNFMGSLFLSKPSSTMALSFSLSTQIDCYAISFATNSIQCAATAYSLLGVHWDFGDPGAGAANSSTLAAPVHIFSGPGTYTVSQIYYYSCGWGADTIKQVINVQPCFSVTSAVSCGGLGSATVSIINGIGPFSYTWMPSGQNSPVATNLSPGVYTITGYDAGSNTLYTSNIVLTPSVPLLGSISVSTVLVCYGAQTGTGSITNVTGGSSNQNYLWTNGSVTYTTSTVSNLSAGLWTISVTDALTGCHFGQVSVITQPPAMTLNISPSAPGVCLGQTISLTGASSGGTPFLSGSPYIYNWNLGPAVSTHTVSESIAGIYIYSLTVTDSLGCSITETISVAFVPVPSLSVSNVSICPLETGVLICYGATNYTWYSSALSSNGQVFFDSPLSSSAYTVVGSVFTCSNSTTANIFVKPLPFISIAASSPLCEGDVMMLAAYGGTSYVWAGPWGFNSSVQNPTVAQVSLSHNGVYTVTLTGANACTISTSGTVQVNPTPSISITSTSTVCDSRTLNLSASSIPGSSYIWSGPQNFSSGLQSTFVLPPLTAGVKNYTVNVLSPQNCKNTAVASVSVVPAPNLNASLSSLSLCAEALSGSPNSITLTSSGADTYTLVTPLHIANTSPNGPNSPIITQPPLNAGIATATLYGSNGVCTDFITSTFSIVPNPTVSISSPTPVICAGENFTYTSFGALSYTWGPNSPNLMTYSTGDIAVVNPSINSVFSVVGGSLGCYSAIKTTSITVNPVPTLSLWPENPRVCFKESVDLFASGTGTLFSWAPATGLSSNSGIEITAIPYVSQQYTVITSLNSCTSSAVINVSVLTLPTPTILQSKTLACLNEEIMFTGFGGESFQWQGSQFYNLGNPLTIKLLNVSLAQVYTLTVADKNGCLASTTSSPIVILPVPLGNLNGNMGACVPFCSDYNFQASGTSPINTTWAFDDRIISGNKFSLCFSNPGEHMITAFHIDAVTTCTNIQKFVVTAYPKPKADFSYDPESPIEGRDNVVFNNTSVGEGQDRWSWQFFDNKGYQTKSKTASYLFDESGTFRVAMVVGNNYGCLDTIVKAVKVETDFTFYVPNAFTPNADEKNDLFLPVIHGIRFYELQIFNRWGQRLFLTRDLEHGWDGSFSGQECKQDIYTWKIILSIQGGEEKTYTGSVFLTR